jgi:serine phosphatase RsbU (regulator of sigma subunit)/PAS domain-containing protein
VPIVGRAADLTDRRAAVALAAGAVSAVAVADVLTSGVPLYGAVMVGPILAAAYMPALPTVLVGIYAFVVAVLLGMQDGIGGSTRHLIGLSVIAAVVAGSAWLSAQRTRRERELEQTRPDAELGRRLGLALEAGRMGTWWWDRASGEVHYDDRLAALYGRTRTAMPATLDAWMELLHPDERDRAVSGSAIEADGRFRFEHQVLYPDGSTRWRMAVGEVAVDNEGQITGAVGVTADIDQRRRAEDSERAARERAERAVEVLGRFHAITDEALTRLPLDELLAALPARIAELLSCETVRVLLLDSTRTNLEVAASYGFLEAYPAVPVPIGRGYEGRIAAADAPIVVEDLADMDVVSPALRTEVRSAAGVPLRADELVGVLDVGRRTVRPFGEEDIDLLRLAGESIARAIQRSRIFELERTARERADYLTRVQDALTRSRGLPELMAEVTRAAVPRLGDWCSLLVADPTAGPLIEVAHADPAEAAWARELVERYPFDPDAPTGSAAVIRTGRPEFYPVIDPSVFDQVSEDEEIRGALRRLRIRSSMTVPLSVGREVVGALSLARSLNGMAYTNGDLRLATDLADRIAAAVQNTLLYQQQRAIADTLQRSLLPARLPSIPGVELAVRYWTPPSAGEVGGDFYDAFALADDRWGVVIGDISGKGVTAAALTGVARHTVRAAARHGLPPATVLAWLHEALADHAKQSGGQFCTALYGVVCRDADGSITFRFVLGGQPAPLYLPAAGEPQLVGRYGTLLGTGVRPRVHETAVRLQPGDQLILYTDGVSDVAGPTHLDEAQLLALAHRHLAASAEATAGQLETAVQQHHSSARSVDDAALLVLRVLPLPERTQSEELSGDGRALDAWSSSPLRTGAG